MKKKSLLLLTILSLFLFSCTSRKPEPEQETSTTSNFYGGYSSNVDVDEDEFDTDDEDNDDENIWDDGTYSAIVDYYNPDTGFSNTYTLDVEVEDGQVVQIDFPNGGWLDSDHIDPAEIDEDGCCTVYGEDGKTYEISIER